MLFVLYYKCPALKFVIVYNKNAMHLIFINPKFSKKEKKTLCIFWYTNKKAAVNVATVVEKSFTVE